MIHHDHAARQIEEHRATLRLVLELRRSDTPRAARDPIDRDLRRLLDLTREDLIRLSFTELLARLARTGTAHDVRLRTFFLIRLLEEAGETEEAAGNPEGADLHRTQALDLLLDAVDRPEICERPDYVPTVDALLSKLGNTTLPPATTARLMRHQEHAGHFGRAEDCLDDLLAAAPDSPEVRSLGEAFYRRLLALNDSTLVRGNFSRAEAEEGLTRLRSGTTA